MLRTGRKIGRIRIGESLGEGGMGVVFLGFDEKLQREVAVKAIRRERLDEESRRRLLTEARILSRLDHPNICRIYEFLEEEDEEILVLELVRGRNLQDRPAEDLSAGERLAIAEQIGRALIAAHRQGIVHRDLKLGNVMLTKGGSVKVLDFGLARPEGGGDLDSDALKRLQAALDAAGAEGASSGGAEDEPSISWRHSMFVSGRDGAVVGTLAQMSPEQARGEPASAASDMYSYGLLLQELMTGRPAYPEDLDPEMLLIKAEDGDTIPARTGDAEVDALIERLKSLAPSARPSAAEAVREIVRILDRPQRRLRLAVLIAAILFLTIGGLKYLTDVRKERNEALTAREEAVVALEEAETARREAEQATDFLLDLIEAASPAHAQGGQITVAEVFERSTQKIEKLTDQPSMQARLQSTIAEVFHVLGRYEEAIEFHRDALTKFEEMYGPRSAEAAGSRAQIAHLFGETVRFEAAEKEAALAMEIFEELGDLDLDLEHRKAKATAWVEYAAALRRRGELEEAESLQLRALEMQRESLAPDHSDMGWILQQTAVFYYEQRRFETAIDYLLESLPILKSTLGPEHPEIGSTLVLLGNCFRLLGDFNQGREYTEQGLAVQRRALGPEHPDLAAGVFQLGGIAQRFGDFEAARRLTWEAHDLLEASLGSDYPGLGPTLLSLSQIERSVGRLDVAMELIERSLSYNRHKIGMDNYRAGRRLREKAQILFQQGERTEAGKSLDEALERLLQDLSPEDHEVDAVRLLRVSWFMEDAEPEGARRAYAEIETSTRRRLEIDSKSARDRRMLAACRSGLGRLAQRRGDAERAERLRREALEILGEPREPEFVETLALRVRILRELGDSEAAEPLAEKLAAAGFRL